MLFNSKGREEVTYDAIVVGSGISGGWAAKELTDKGLKTLVLDRGRNIKHGEYPTANWETWDAPLNGRNDYKEQMEHYPKQSRTGYTTSQYTKHWFVKDSEHPYNEDKRFDWCRGYHVGGRSITWGRHVYRWSEMDFVANAKEGVAVDWPIRYKDIEPWYDYVEKYIGIQGTKEGLAQVPDAQFMGSFSLNCVEQHARERIKKSLGWTMTIGRTAHLTKPHKGRGKCQNRDRCIRGCPYGAYFSSQASTLPAAEVTGNMTLRPFSIVHSLIYDQATDKAIGVNVIDTETKETFEYYAKVIFLCASTIASTSILMNSKSERFENGMGNDSGELGHNLMDHHFMTGATADVDGYDDKYYKGRRPTGFYVARSSNLDHNSKKDYLRGFGYQGSASRSGWGRAVAELKAGPQFKDLMGTPGKWRMGMTAFAEMLPDHRNQMYLDYEKLDKWGIPTVTFDCENKENEMAMRADMANNAAEMLDASGFNNVQTYDNIGGPGLGIHEMGTARMGRDPKTSVLNANNAIHAVPNVYVTDGACMTSSACQNPSITYMALTARAVNHAVDQINNNNI
ncbi:MAG: GMC family oxidoreductase [Saprospiraceae bacterium]